MSLTGRSMRLRKLFRPTRELQWALFALVLGLVSLCAGFLLSFKGLLRPGLERAVQATRDAVEGYVPDGQAPQTIHLLGGLLILLGLYLVWVGFRRGSSHFLSTLNPGLRGGSVDVYLRRLQLAEGPRVAAIGGGTGLSTLLRGLKNHTSNITAIVTVTDDGGSSGRLKKDKGMIPPGDIRNCLVALADAEKSMTDLFQHRFREDSGALSGHSIGNLLIAALTDQHKGDFERAVQAASDVLAIRGRVLPSTLSQVNLVARLADGREVTGETAIVESGSAIQELRLEPADCAPQSSVLEAIRDADLLCIGPGSVFTSVVPNLLVPGVVEAIRAAACPKVYICNVMTQPGESEGFTAAQHVDAIERIVGRRVFDWVLVNTAVPSDELLEKYRDSRQHRVEADVDQIHRKGYRLIAGNFMNATDVVRHDPVRVADRLMHLIEHNR